jgi:hypothetical protein
MTCRYHEEAKPGEFCPAEKKKKFYRGEIQPGANRGRPLFFTLDKSAKQ